MKTLVKLSNDTAPALAWHTLAVGVLTLVWTGMAFAKFGPIGTASPEITGWGQTFIAASLWGGLGASVFLLARSHWALQGFVTAVVGVMGAALHAVVFSDQPVGLHELPALFGSWLIMLTGLFYTYRINSLGLLR